MKRHTKYSIMMSQSTINNIKAYDCNGRWFSEKMLIYIYDILGLKYISYEGDSIVFTRSLTKEEIIKLSEFGIELTKVHSIFLDDLIKKLTDKKEYNAIKIIIDEFC